MRIKFVSRRPCWCARSAACFTTSVAISPPKFTSTTTSSASKSSWHFTAASPHCAGLPVVERSASTANLPSFNNADATMPTSSLPPDGSTPTSDLLDQIFGHLIVDEPVIFEQRVLRIEDHRAL